jgi:hypothetical protein
LQNAIEHASKVRILALRGRWVDDHVLARLRAFDRLVTLNIEDLSDSGEGLMNLAGRPIQYISLTHVSVRRVTLAGLAGLPELRSITLAGSPETVDGLAALGGHSHLVSATLHVRTLTDVGFVARLPSLRDLTLDKCGVLSLLPLSQASTLRHLSLDDTPVADGELENLADLALETISLNDVPITDEGITHVCRNAQLRRVWLAGTAITDASLARLGALPHLERLDVRRTLVTAEGIAALTGRRPRLHVLTDMAPAPRKAPS